MGAIGTLFLALATIRTLSQNEDLIEKQQSRIENQEAQLRPEIRRVSKYEVDKKYENHVIIDFQNIGEGKGINIQLKPELYIRDSYPFITIEEYSERVYQDDTEFPVISTSSTPLYAINMYDDLIDPLPSEVMGISGSPRSKAGGILESGNRNQFIARLSYVNKNNNMISVMEDSEDKLDGQSPQDILNKDPEKEPPVMLFNDMIGVLKQKGVEEIGFQFILTYEDVLGNEYSKKLDSPIFEARKVSTLSDSLTANLWSRELYNKYS